MSDSQPPFSPTSPVVQPLPLHHPTRLVPPPRPPRLRPDSRSSSVVTDSRDSTPNWTEVTLADLLDRSQETLPPTGYRNHIRGSYVDMHKEPSEAISPVRESSSPTATQDGDGKRSSKQTTKSAYSSDASSPSPHPAHSRSAVKSAFLVLSCAGAMIINVSFRVFECICMRGD